MMEFLSHVTTPDLITPAKSLLPREVTRAQLLGIAACHSRGIIIQRSAAAGMWHCLAAGVGHVAIGGVRGLRAQTCTEPRGRGVTAEGGVRRPPGADDKLGEALPGSGRHTSQDSGLVQEPQHRGAAPGCRGAPRSLRPRSSLALLGCVARFLTSGARPPRPSLPMSPVCVSRLLS